MPYTASDCYYDGVSQSQPLILSLLEVCAVRYGRFFSKFITELIEISFFIIGTDAHRLRSVFSGRFIWFDRFEILKRNWAFKPNINISTYSRFQVNTNSFFLFSKSFVQKPATMLYNIIYVSSYNTNNQP